MELNDLLPSGGGWRIKNDFIMFHKLENLPICYIGSDEVVYVFLDNRIPKEVLKFTKNLLKLGVNFFFTTPKASNPKGVDNLNYEIVKHYLFSYANPKFFYGFSKLDFDLIDNMVKWTEYASCFELVKPAYEKINKKVHSRYHDYYANRYVYEYDEVIRENFNGLYRHIQISKII